MSEMAEFTALKTDKVTEYGQTGSSIEVEVKKKHLSCGRRVFLLPSPRD